MRSDKIIYCRCSYGKYVNKESGKLLHEILKSSGRELLVLDDLCRGAAEKEPRLADFLKQGNSTVIACHPRAVKWLLAFSGIEMSTIESLQCLNIMELSLKSILQILKIDIPEKHKNSLENLNPLMQIPSSDDLQENSASFEKEYALANSQGSTRPWFPVIDYSRCTDCGACMDFCLFGVYEKINDKIEVKNPFNCKDNCPACARICPHHAIIFPKYNRAPVNGDLEGCEESMPYKKPIFALSGDELYNALKQRKKNNKKLYKE